MNKSFFLKLFSWLIVGLILWFLINNLITNWQAVREYHYRISIAYLSLSSLFYILGMFLFTQVWRKILEKFGHRLSPVKAFKVVFLSLFGRYLPGKIWLFLVRFQLLKEEGVSKKIFIVTSIFENGLVIISGLLLALLFVGKYFLNSNYFIFVLTIIILGTICLFPKIFYPAFNFLLKKIKKNKIPAELQLKFPDLLKILLFYFISWIVWGSSFYFFVNSLTFVSPEKMPALIGIFVLSYISGYLALFAPMGIGVREGTQSYFLNYFIPTGIAILVSFLARLWAILNELVLFGITWIYSKATKKPLLNKG